MPKFLLIAFLVQITLLSCRSNYALLNDSYTPVYGKKTVEKNLKMKINKLKLKPAFIETKRIKTDRKIKPVRKYFPEIKIANPKVVIPVFKESKVELVLNKQDPKEKLKEKKKRKRRRFWRQMGSNLLIGVVLLGVAVILSIIHMETLALLFGLASILFLIFGLKKIFKRRRIRNPFQKNR